MKEKGRERGREERGGEGEREGERKGGRGRGEEREREREDKNKTPSIGDPQRSPLLSDLRSNKASEGFTGVQIDPSKRLNLSSDVAHYSINTSWKPWPCTFLTLDHLGTCMYMCRCTCKYKNTYVLNTSQNDVHTLLLTHQLHTHQLHTHTHTHTHRGFYYMLRLQENVHT